MSGWCFEVRRHILSPHFFFCTTYFCLSFQASNDCNLISSSEKASSPKDAPPFVRDNLRVRGHLTPFNLLTGIVTFRQESILPYVTYFRRFGAVVQSRPLICELNGQLQNSLSEPFASLSANVRHDQVRLTSPAKCGR